MRQFGSSNYEQGSQQRKIYNNNTHKMCRSKVAKSFSSVLQVEKA